MSSSMMKKSTSSKSGMMKKSSSTKGSMNVFHHPSPSPAPHPTEETPFYYPKMSMKGSKMGMMMSYYKGHAGAGAYSSSSMKKSMSSKGMGKSSMSSKGMSSKGMSGKGMSYSKSYSKSMMGMSKSSTKKSMMSGKGKGKGKGKGSSVRMMGGKGPYGENRFDMNLTLCKGVKSFAPRDWVTLSR